MTGLKKDTSGEPKDADNKETKGDEEAEGVYEDVGGERADGVRDHYEPVDESTMTEDVLYELPSYPDKDSHKHALYPPPKDYEELPYD